MWVKYLFQILKLFRWDLKTSSCWLRLAVSQPAFTICGSCPHILPPRCPPHSLSPHPCSLLPPNLGKAVGLPEPLHTPATPTLGQPREFLLLQNVPMSTSPQIYLPFKKSCTPSSALAPLSEVYSPGSCQLCAPTSLPHQVAPCVTRA